MIRNYLDYAGLKRVIGKLFGIKKIWHGTQAEWDALTPAERDYYDQAEVIDAGEEAYQYTTEEVYTGKKWIDGKKIYRKVLLCTQASVLPASQAWVFIPGWADAIPNINQFIQVNFDSNQYAKRIDFVNEEGRLKFVCLVGNITIAVGAAVIVEYTKTTD